MKSTILFALLFGFVCMAMSQLPAKFSQANIDAVLSNDRVLTNYLKCLLDQGACTREGNELKKLLPIALQTDCAQCTPIQKKNSKKVMNYLKSRRPHEFKALTDKYDPLGFHKQRLIAGLI